MLCPLCHPPRESRDGGVLCRVCMGLEEPEQEKEMEENEATIQPEPEIASESGKGFCLTCGDHFEPYQLGRNTVRDRECHTCLMRRKYGPKWQPGKAKKKNGDGSTRGKEPLTDAEESASIMLTFRDTDMEIYRGLFGLAGKERRTIDQQVLWFLERAMAQVVG